MLEQDADRLTESLADAPKTAANVFTFKERRKLAKSKKTLFDKDVKKECSDVISRLTDTNDIALRLAKLNT